jgi:glycerophosphoryl diester phosphodiesterase
MIYWCVGFAAVAVVVIYVLLVAPGRAPKGAGRLWEAHYAHRGLYSADQSVPENSLAAFAAAADVGYGMELDITMTTDDEIVVFHDDMLSRACGVGKDIRDCSWAELQSYRLFGTDQRIPLFSELLALVNGRVPLIVELKHTKRYRALCAKTAEKLDNYTGPYCIESFDPRIVRWFAVHRPEVVRGQLAGGIRSYESARFCESLLMSAVMTNIYCRPHFVAYRHQDAPRKLGLKAYRWLGGHLVAWTVQSMEDEIRCQPLFGTVIFEFYRP